MCLPDGNLVRIPHGAVETTTSGKRHPTLVLLTNVKAPFGQKLTQRLVTKYLKETDHWWTILSIDVGDRFTGCTMKCPKNMWVRYLSTKGISRFQFFPRFEIYHVFFSLKMPHFQLLENLEMYSVPHLVVIMRRIGHFEEKARDQFDDEK